MSKSKHANEGRELTKPNMAKVREKILNTKKCSEEQPNNAIVTANLARLTKKYPQVEIA